MAEHYEIVQFFSKIAWGFAAIRQFKSRFFHYFLILALADPVNTILKDFLSINFNGYYIVISFLLIVSVLNSGKREKMDFLVTLISLIALLPTFFISHPFVALGVVLFNFGVMMLFARMALLTFNDTKIVNLYLLMLVFYSITLCAKYIPYISDPWKYVDYFVSIGAFQILIAIFFAIFTEDSPAMRIKLKNKLAFKRE